MVGIRNCTPSDFGGIENCTTSDFGASTIAPLLALGASQIAPPPAENVMLISKGCIKMLDLVQPG